MRIHGHHHDRTPYMFSLKLTNNRRSTHTNQVTVGLPICVILAGGRWVFKTENPSHPLFKHASWNKICWTIWWCYVALFYKTVCILIHHMKYCSIYQQYLCEIEFYIHGEGGSPSLLLYHYFSGYYPINSQFTSCHTTLLVTFQTPFFCTPSRYCTHLSECNLSLLNATYL